MRIWSLHPKYLDSKGLVALWRETLLAKNVLEGNTKGYKYHPQLQRFKASAIPLDSIHFYLKHVWLEAKNRDYNFDENKFSEPRDAVKIGVSRGQLNYEREHLLAKLDIRDQLKFKELSTQHEIETHPLFFLYEGEIESWEIR